MDRLEPAESEKLQESLDKVIITGNEKEVLNQCIHRWEFKRLESRERQLRDILSSQTKKIRNRSTDLL